MKSSPKVPKFSAETVSVDYFLYSCFEHENASRARPVNGELKWPTAVACSKDESSKELEDHTLEELLIELCHWHKTKSPQLQDTKPISLENLADIVPSFVQLTEDLDQVVKGKTTDYLPTYDEANVDKIWLTVKKVLEDNFPHFAEMFLRYLHWSHASQPPVIKEEPGSRPPVGRFASHQKRNMDRPHQRDDRDRGNYNRGKPDSQKYSKDHPEKGRNRDHRKKGGRNSHTGPAKKNPDLERETLKAVLLAVQKLNKDKELKEFSLPPANSFYRRLQHKQIAEEGLFSKSDGTGNGRRVVILRDKPEKDSQ